MSTPHVYIAGPMRGYPYFNFNAFYDAEEAVYGYFAVNPRAYDPCPVIWPNDSRSSDFKPGVTEWESVTIFNPARYDQETIGPSVNDSPTGDLADIEGVFDLRHALGRDLAWIAEKGTHIYLLDGWEKSSGARAEHALAVALGLEVMYQTEPDAVSPLPPELVELSTPTTTVPVYTGKPIVTSNAAGYIATEWVGTPPLDETYRYSTPYQGSAPTGEVRKTSATGGEKGSKPAQLGAIDPLALTRLAEVAGFGAQKYARYNYLKGYDWSLTYDACQRHILAFWNGEDSDPESNLPHLAHAAWHCLAMLSFLERGLGEDDRPQSVWA